jgi:hypothetical protein
MPAVISLRDVVEAIDLPSDEMASYLNPETGEILTVSEEEQDLLERGDSDESLQEWERELLPKLREAVESDRWLVLPDRFEVHEWSIMERFSRTVESKHDHEELVDAIHGTGAFRLFHRTIERLGLRDGWFKFRDCEYERIAREWLESQGLEYK